MVKNDSLPSTTEVGDSPMDGETTGRGSSMYTELLYSALDAWVDSPDEAVLIDHVVKCRNEMLIAIPHRDENAYSALAAEVSYDRALIKLCEANGIEASAANFTNPSEERRRLEKALAGAGINLTALARQHRA